MKKYLFIAAAAMVFAACSSDDNEVAPVVEQAIGFSTIANSQTRGADNNENVTNWWALEGHHTNFNVWAWKYFDGAWVTTAVYDKGTVTHDGTDWVANPIRFWDKSAEKYMFYAAAPASDVWTFTGTGADGTLAYNGLTLAGGSDNNLSTISETGYVQSFATVDDVDLMIAENNEVPRTSYNVSASETPAKVNLKFNHCLSRLNVTVKKGTQLETAGATLKLTGFEIYGKTMVNKGNFTENAVTGETLAKGTYGRWSNTSVSGTYTLPGACDATNGTEITATTTAEAPYIAQYLIIPQAITSEVLDRGTAKTVAETPADATYPYFKITYTIEDEPYVAYYNLAYAFNVASGKTLAFNEGWQNTLNITIDADVILFDAVVAEWTDNANQNLTIK